MEQPNQPGVANLHFLEWPASTAQSSCRPTWNSAPRSDQINMCSALANLLTTQSVLLPLLLFHQLLLPLAPLVSSCSYPLLILLFPSLHSLINLHFLYFHILLILHFLLPFTYLLPSCSLWRGTGVGGWGFCGVWRTSQAEGPVFYGI